MRKRKGIFRSKNYLLTLTVEEFHFLHTKAKLKLHKTVAFFIRSKLFPGNWKMEHAKLKKELGGESNG